MTDPMKIEYREKLLLRKLASGSPCTGEEAEILFRNLDMDTERPEYLLMLGILGSKTDFLNFPEDVRARTAGVCTAARLKNIHGIPWFLEKLKGLEERGIPVMLLKGIAMRAYYAPTLARQMSDFDIAVPERCYADAGEFLGSADELLTRAIHADTFGTAERKIDLHRWIFKTGSAGEKIWERAAAAKFHGREVRIPCPEDMLIHLIDTKGRDILRGNQPNRKLKWLLDARLVMEYGQIRDWETLSERAKELGSEHYLAWLMPLFASVFPDVISREEASEYFPRDAAYEAWKHRMLIYMSAYRRFHEYRDRVVSRHVPPGLVMRSLLYYRVEYDCYYRPEMDAKGEWMNFPEYYLAAHHVETPLALMRRFWNLCSGKEA